MNKSESKYFNTAVRMDEALLSLLHEKSFEYITIKEICKKAGVNRSTFYLHYENTSDLLVESIKYINDQFLECFTPKSKDIASKINSCTLEELILVTPEYLIPYLEYINDHKCLFCTAISKPAVLRSHQSYQNLFEHIFSPILERFSIPSQEKNYIMAFYINGLIAIITEWLQKDCADPIEYLIGTIQKCVIPHTTFPQKI